MWLIGLPEYLNIDYKPNGSSVVDRTNVIRTFNAFGYMNPGTLVDYDWMEVYETLIKGGPVIICAKSKHKKTWIFEYYTDGHAWNIDEILVYQRDTNWYKTNGKAKPIFKRKEIEAQYYVHCNWGWRGYSDGYYLSGIFDTNAGPTQIPGTRSENEDDGDAISEGVNGYYQYEIEIISQIHPTKK